MGDPVIAHCTEWLFTKDIEDFNVRHVTLDHVDHKLRFSFANRIKRKIRKLFGREWTYDEFTDKVYEQSIAYFNRKIKHSDWIVVVGGGLVKYKYQMLGVELAALCVAADSQQIPVIVNSVGIEGYDADDKICKMMKQAFELPSIKSVTTRDDIKTLKNCFLENAIHVYCEKVADPAVWTSEAYGVQKKGSNKVGLGIGRAGLFKANGINLDGTQLQELYVSIAVELAKRGYEVELFTNGLLSDDNMAQKVQESLDNYGLKLNIRLPQSDSELVEIISSYAMVVATRLHSTIISYALDIPAVGLVWNEKLSFFGQNIGSPDNFIQPNLFDSTYIVNQVEKAAENGYDQQRKVDFKKSIMKNVDFIINNFILTA